jgi:hypothetical protein
MMTTIFEAETEIGNLIFIYLSNIFLRLTTTTDCSIGLPTALSALRQTPSSTIFTTEQSVEEAASQAILEQHVKLTEKSVPSSSSSTASSRAPICRAFKYDIPK